MSIRYLETGLEGLKLSKATASYAILFYFSLYRAILEEECNLSCFKIQVDIASEKFEANNYFLSYR